MTRAELLAEGLLASCRSIARYFPGFDDSNRARQAPHMPNHFAWCLGHLALVMHRGAEKFGGAPTLPESDFITGGHASGGGDASRFATESVAFASKPVPDASQYPTAERCVAIFNAAADRLARDIRACADSRLDEHVKWGTRELPLYQIAFLFSTHNGMHCGQIADLRRALGFKSIFA